MPPVDSAAPPAARQELSTTTAAHGIVAGVIGYLVVVLMVGALDAARGRSFFFTAAMLGEAAFHGLTDPADVTVEAGPVLAYNGVHLIAFLGLGLLGAWLVRLAQRGAQLWFPAVVVFALVVAHAWGALLLMTEQLRAAMPAWEVGLPTLAAVVGMASYLLATHPTLRRAPGSWAG